MTPRTCDGQVGEQPGADGDADAGGDAQAGQPAEAGALAAELPHLPDIGDDGRHHHHGDGEGHVEEGRQNRHRHHRQAGAERALDQAAQRQRDEDDEVFRDHGWLPEFEC